MSRPAYSLCLCPDSRLLRGCLDRLLAVHAPSGSSPHEHWQRVVFWGDEGLGPSFWEELNLQGLFASPKALVLRNAQALPADVLKTLSKALLPLAGKPDAPLPRPLLWPLLCFEAPIEKGKPKLPAHILQLPCWLEAEKRGWLEVTQSLNPATLPAFIRAESESLGLTLRPEDLHLLARALPPDAAFIASEMLKLSLLADAEGRLPRDALSFVAHAQELSIFELLRKVQQRSDAPAVWRQVLEDKISGESMVFAFTAIVLREARLLWQCLAGPAPFLPQQAALQKKIAAESLGYAGIARLWDLALRTDKGIKSGERSPDQAFEMLIGELFVLFGEGRKQH